MRGLRRTEKFKTDKPSNQNLKRKQRGMAELETGGQELRSACDTKQRSGERKSQEAEYRNRKDGMETGRTEEERVGDERNRSAPLEPLPGENGKQGKERAEG